MPSLNVKDLEGQNINERTRITRFRASGVYGYVFEADVLSMGRAVGRCAVKLVHARSIHSPEAMLEDLRAQAQQLVHPSLLAIQSSGLIFGGSGDGWIYLTTELAEITLQELLDRGQRMAAPQAREMLSQLCEGVVFLHSKGVTHGDIRPSNLLLTADGWKLSGVEYRGMYGRRLEEVGAQEHLFVFRAPETFDRPVENPAVDVWSIGVVAHACLTGGLPFAEASDLSRSDMLWKISNQDPEPEELGSPFDLLVAGCLRRDPIQRWSADQALSAMTGKPQRLAKPILEESPLEMKAPPAVLLNPEPPESTWAKKLLLGVGLTLLGFGVVLGFALTPKPVKFVANVKPGQLSNIDFKQGLIDDRGRLQTREQRTRALREDLGDDVSLELVEVPGGEFTEGSAPSEPRRESDESPQHQVRVDLLYLGRREISQAQWARVASFPKVDIVLPADPSKFRGRDLPVQNITYGETVEFCHRISQKLGRIYRLPTEAEWEYGCRGGQKNEPFGFGATITDEVANFQSGQPYLDEGAPGRPRNLPTNSHYFKVCNAFGLVDMHGNLKEWCLDNYGPYPNRSESNPAGPSEGTERVVRGGSFRTFPWGCRSAARSHVPPDQRREDVGFRVAVPEQVPELPR